MPLVQRLTGALLGLLTGVSALLVILALAMLPFLNPVWVGFEQGRAQATAWTGFSEADLRTVTDAVLADLIVGPPDFDVQLAGAPVLNPREIKHMQDVRDVFAKFFLVAIMAAALLVLLRILAPTREQAARYWRRLRRTGIVVAIGTVVVGVLGVAFFDTAFEIFHELFFPAGSYLFDPRTERLVQLFPEQFWVETTVGVGIVVIALGLLLAWVARRRERKAEG